jgi:hypothetical protein
VQAEARLVEQPWGTRLTLEASGLTAGTTYGAWLERADGSRVGAGTFRAETGRVVVTLTAALPLAEAEPSASARSTAPTCSAPLG